MFGGVYYGGNEMIHYMNKDGNEMSYEIEYEIPVQNSIQTEIEKLPTTSAKIRFLDQKGYSRYKIAQTLKIRYQHVRNVLITPVSKPRG